MEGGSVRKKKRITGTWEKRAAAPEGGGPPRNLPSPHKTGEKSNNRNLQQKGAYFPGMSLTLKGRFSNSFLVPPQRWFRHHKSLPLKVLSPRSFELRRNSEPRSRSFSKALKREGISINQNGEWGGGGNYDNKGKGGRHSIFKKVPVRGNSNQNTVARSP